VTLGTEAHGIDMKWRVVRALPGDDAARLPSTAWINVGTTPSGQGIINFRQTVADRGQPSGSAECFIDYRFGILHHLLDGAQRGQPLELTMVLGVEPKPDDWAAFFLLDHTLRKGALPAGAKGFADYMGRCRRSTLEIIPRSKRNAARKYFEDVSAGLARGECSPVVTLALACELLRNQNQQADDEYNFRAFGKLFRSALGLEEDRQRGANPEYFEMVDAPLGWWIDAVDSGLDALRDFWKFAEVVKEQSKFQTLSIEPPIRKVKDDRRITINVFRCDDARQRPDEVWREKLCQTSGLIAPDGTPAGATLTIHSGKEKDSWNIHFETNSALPESESINQQMPALARMLEFEEQVLRGTEDPRRGPVARYPDFPDIEDPWYDGRDHGYAFLSSPRIGTIIPPERLLEILSLTPWLTAFHDRRDGFTTEQFAVPIGDSKFSVCVVWRRKQLDEQGKSDVISLARHLLGDSVQRLPLTDRCECWLTPWGVLLLDVGDTPRDISVWKSAVESVLEYRLSLERIKASNETGSESQLDMFYESLRNWNPWRFRDPAARTLVEALDGALGGRTMRENLAEYLRFSDERQRIREEDTRQKWNKFLTVILALISVLSLLQIPLELIQAYGAGEQAWLDAAWLWSPPRWIWWILPSFGIVFVIILAPLLRRKRPRSPCD